MLLPNMTTAYIERYRSSLQKRAFRFNSVRAYVADVRCFFTEMNLTEICMEKIEDQVSEWLQKHRPSWKPKTAIRKQTSLKDFLKWLGIPQPLEGFRNPTPARAQPHPLPGGFTDLRNMLMSAETEDISILITLCGLVGLRIAEAMNVHTEHFNFKDKLLTVCGKGDKTRVVPISPLAWRFLQDRATRVWLAGGGNLVNMSERTARKYITNTAERAGISRRVSSHDLRATFATEAYARTKDLRIVAELLGHSSVETTMIYVQAQMHAMREAANFGGDDG